MYRNIISVYFSIWLSRQRIIPNSRIETLMPRYVASLYLKEIFREDIISFLQYSRYRKYGLTGAGILFTAFVVTIITVIILAPMSSSAQEGAGDDGSSFTT